MKTKKLLTTSTLLMAALTMTAQQTPQILSERQAMLRLQSEGSFLLLPVEEKSEMASVRVIDDNQVVKTFNVRLAADKADYCVPLAVKGGELLDITFHGDRRAKGALKELACWREMKYVDSFDTTNRERFRPVYHHTPVYGWMNDPNGMFYKDGVWHLYYQWNPYGSQWENMTWGHSTSRDLIHWDAQPAAIEMDALGSIFSGSCVVVDKKRGGDADGSVVAFYTSAGQSQVQSMAVSHDNGSTFKKYAGNPVLTSGDPDFRDPKAFWNDQTRKWNLVLAVGQEMRFYSSTDLKNWTYESSFGKGYGCHDGVWECPDMMKLPVRGTGEYKWMLICNINPGGIFGGSATQYFIGDFDGHEFRCDHKDTRWMDYGKDHYATVTFDNAPDGRRVALAWMSNWQYANQVPTMQFRSANSVPRDLDLFAYNGQIYCGVTPSKELLAVRGKKIKRPSDACEIVVDVKGTAEIVLSNTKGEQVVMTYEARQQTFAMDRTKSGDVSFSENFATTTTAPTYGQLHQLRIFIDRSSIEAFDSDGHVAMTNLVFPSEPYTILKVKGGKATVYDIKK